MRLRHLLAFLLAADAVASDAQPVRRAARAAVRAVRTRGSDTTAAAPADTAAAQPGGGYVIGRNRYTTLVNGDTREYLVHVPRQYTPSTAVPVVFMLHGTSGDGQRFYDISGWKEVGDANTVLTVYPSSWQHCIFENGQRKNTTKWHVYPANFDYCPGEVPKDDVRFLLQALDELAARFTVDPARIYFVGFSNGGQMSGRMGIDASHRIAAVVSASGFLPAQASFTPQRKLPNLLLLGNLDDRAFGAAAGPMDFDQLFAQNAFIRGMMLTYVNTYGLDTAYVTGGDPATMVTLDTRGLSGEPQNLLHFDLVKDLTHNYPNGRNHPMQGAKRHWEWLRRFTLPGGAAGAPRGNGAPGRGGRPRPLRRLRPDSGGAAGAFPG